MPFTCLFFSFWECASDDEQWMCSRDSVLTASPIRGKTISIYGAPMWPRLFGNRPKTLFYNNLLPFLKLYTWWLLPFEETGREISLNETAHNRKCFGAFLNIQVKWVMDTLCIFVFMYRVRQYRYYKSLDGQLNTFCHRHHTCLSLLTYICNQNSISWETIYSRKTIFNNLTNTAFWKIKTE